MKYTLTGCLDLENYIVEDWGKRRSLQVDELEFDERGTALAMYESMKRLYPSVRWHVWEETQPALMSRITEMV